MTDTSGHTLHGRCRLCGKAAPLDSERHIIAPHSGGTRSDEPWECTGPYRDDPIPLRLAFLADPADPKIPPAEDPTVDPMIEFVSADELGDRHEQEEALKYGRERMRSIPPHYRDAVVTAPLVAEWVRTLVRSVDSDRRTLPRIDQGRSLLLLGPTGTGKTFQAYGALRALSVSGVRAPWRFITMADLYARLRPRARVDSEEEFESFAHVPILALDDIGAAKNTEWTEEINYRLINHRYDRELPTLFTSNVPSKELGAAMGERVASRLVEMTDRVVLRGVDRRLNVKGSAA